MALAVLPAANPSTANNVADVDKFYSQPEFSEFKLPARYAEAPAKLLSTRAHRVVVRDKSAKPLNWTFPSPRVSTTECVCDSRAKANRAPVEALRATAMYS